MRYRTSYIFSLFFILIFPPFVSFAETGPSELRLSFTDTDGRPVNVSKAEVIVVAWGRLERLPLEAGGPTMTVSFDPSWLTSNTSILTRDITYVYLYLQAQGHTAICSRSFHWPGLVTLEGTFDTAEITFPGQKTAVVHEGEKAGVELMFHKPRERCLKFVDEGGAPLEGVKVDSYMYCSSDYNHCARLSEDDLLDNSTSGADGRAVVPDGDFAYAFEVHSPRVPAFLKDPVNPALPNRLYASLDKAETDVVLHQLERRPLKVKVTRNGVPASGEELDGSLSDCPCGACFSQVGVSDREGVIYVPDFYPESYDRIFFAAKAGGFLWERDPRKSTDLEYKVNLGDGH